MLRIAAVFPDGMQPEYAAAIARHQEFEITLSVGSELAGVPSVDDLTGLSQRLDEFDACVVHQARGDILRQVSEWAKAGKHVLMDAPNCDTTMLNELSAISDRTGTTIANSQRRRFTAYASTIKSSLDANQLGDAGLVRIHRWIRDSDHVTDATIWNMSVQETDLACWLFGDQPHSVFARPLNSGSSLKGMLLHLGFATGMALIDCASHAGRSFYALSTIGSQGAAYADDHHNTSLLLSDTTQGINVADDVSSWRAQLEAFANAVDDSTNDRSLMDTKCAIGICHAAVQSAAQQRVAKLQGGQYELH